LLNVVSDIDNKFFTEFYLLVVINLGVLFIWEKAW